MPPTRLKSSFIYLANAVNDLRAQWAALAIVLAPLVLIAALCVLPTAINLQHAVAEHFTPGARHVGWFGVQEPYAPAVEDVKPLVPWWMVGLLNLFALILTFGANLLVLCSIRRLRSGQREAQLLTEAFATWREAIRLAPGFFWIVFLQVAAPGAALFLWRADFYLSPWWLGLAVYVFEVAFMLIAALLFVWLYFADYALVFERSRSFHALLRSRDLMRKRFFRVAMRIVVFLAVWSGYDSWAAGIFLVTSWILGPVGFLTGYFWSFFFVVELAAVAVTYILATFFMLAGFRLYQDLTESVHLEAAAEASNHASVAL
ncbi:MAG TPA: hypothetical protein VNU00_04100 [Candidatus Binataceae bacterium]|nr:hypothetical protein [Candidatus Binataceae bacterium]